MAKALQRRQAAVSNGQDIFYLNKETDGKGDFRAKGGQRLYSAPEISSMILRKLKKDAEDYIGGGSDRP